MKALNISIKLFSVFFLYSVDVVQSMELEDFSIENQKNQCNEISQNRSLQKMPLCSGISKLAQTLNCLQSGCKGQQLPLELCAKIWGYLDYQDKLNLGILAHSFEHIPQYLQLERCRQTLTLVYDFSYPTNVWDEERGYLHYFYACAKKVCKIRDTTKIDAVRKECKVLLQESNDAAQELINGLKRSKDRDFSKSLNYEKLKRIKEIYDDLNACDMCCMECQDHWRKVDYSFYKWRRNWVNGDPGDFDNTCETITFYIICSPLLCCCTCLCFCPVIFQCLACDCCCLRV